MEITRQQVDVLPGLVTLDWMETRTQPIALRDVVRYLVGVLDAPAARGWVFEVGGPDVLQYVETLQRAANAQGKQLPSVSLPTLASKLLRRACPRTGCSCSPTWTPTRRDLVGSLVNEALVTENGILEVVPGTI